MVQLTHLAPNVTAFSLILIFTSCAPEPRVNEISPSEEVLIQACGQSEELGHGVVVAAGLRSENGELFVDYSMTNRGSKMVYVLDWATPFDTTRKGILRNNCFDVALDGEPVNYRGIMASRGNPSESSYLKLAAGETVSCSLPLKLSYNLEGGGVCSVVVSPRVHDVRSEASEVPALLNETHGCNLRLANPDPLIARL